MDLAEYRDNPKTAYLAVEVDRLDQKINETKSLAATDLSMADLAAEEVKGLVKQKEELERKIIAIAAKDKEEEVKPKGLIMEIRAGAGGEESALFAASLAAMYTRLAELKGWPMKKIDVSESELGGYKEVCFEIKGAEAYDALKYETGVHRVQRIPATEKQGRVHTSTASVAILPIRPMKEFKLDPADLEVETSGRAGGCRRPARIRQDRQSGSLRRARPGPQRSLGGPRRVGLPLRALGTVRSGGFPGHPRADRRGCRDRT